MSKRIGSARFVKRHHKERLREHAKSLNGKSNYEALIRFARKELGIMIDGLTLNHILHPPETKPGSRESPMRFRRMASLVA